ncbi:MAG: hypothetical protein RQ966_05720 [Acetobacteraceae bacterium]|nr:hypothetical protein [Acetobacteraceae bacterium]
MTNPRAIQNFRGFRGIWWGPQNPVPEVLTTTLARLGVTLARIEQIGDTTLTERDVLFVDGDSAFDPAALGAPGRMLLRSPVIGVVGVEAPSRLKALLDVGATALLRKPIHPASVYSSLFLAVNNHARFARLEDRVAEHDRRRSGRRYVIKAVIALMREGMCDEQAYAHLRRESMRRRVGLEDYAYSLCNPPQETDDVENQDPAVGHGSGHSPCDQQPGDELGGRPDQTRRA